MGGTLIGGHVFERWMEHPLVRRARREAGADSSAYDLLESLHGVLTELEERFPGVAFSTILDASTNPEPESVRRAMECAGVPADQIRLVLGERIEPNPSVNLLSESVMELIRAKVPVRAWVEVYGVDEWRASILKPVVHPLTKREQLAVPYLRSGKSEDVTARLAGVSLSVVRSTARKLQYQDWLAKQRVAA